jgi:hypothetical protein
LPLGSSIITAAVALVDLDMLTRVWDEIVYRIDVCRITKCEHIEHLWGKRREREREKVRLSVVQCNKILYPLRSLFTANFLNLSRIYE